MKKPEPFSAALMMANSAFLVIAGFLVLSPPDDQWRGLFLAAVAVVHAALAAYFIRGKGETNVFGLLTAGTGLAALTLAIPVQFGGPVVPVLWGIEGMVLAWVADRRRHTTAALAAVTLGVLAVGHLLVFEYPPDQIASPDPNGQAFLHGNGLSALLVIGFIGTASLVVRQPRYRTLVLSAALLLTVYILPFEFSGVALVAGWLGVFLIAVAAVGRFGTDGTLKFVWSGSNPELGRSVGLEPLSLLAVLTGFLSIAHLFAVDVSQQAFDAATRPDPPFSDTGALSAALIIMALLLASFVTRVERIKRTALLTALGVGAGIIPFEVSESAAVVLWSGLALIPVVVPWQMAGRWVGYRLAAGALGFMAWALLVTQVAPPAQLLDALPRGDERFLLSGPGFALIAITAASWIASMRSLRLPEAWVPIASTIAGSAYLIRYETNWVGTALGWSLLTVLLIEVGSRGTWPNQLLHSEFRVAAAVLGAMTWLVILTEVAPLEQMVNELPRGDERFLISGAAFALMAVIAASLFASARLSGDRYAWIPVASTVAASAYLVRYETGWTGTVVGWSVLAILTVELTPRVASVAKTLHACTAFLIAGGLVITFFEIAPIDRLYVDAETTVNHAFLLSTATVALSALSIALIAIYRRTEGWRYGWVALAGAGTLALYLVSIAIVDHFQAQVGGGTDLETLNWRAQVALSIVWATLGGCTLAAGIRRNYRPARVFGLSLLGLATAKVFTYDMASLDTSYRMLSFIGLGALLLGSSYLYQRMLGQPGPPTTSADNGESDEEKLDQMDPVPVKSDLLTRLRSHHLGGHGTTS